METAVNKASKAEDAYVLSTKPDLARLKEDGIPKQRYASELGQTRAQLEAAGDNQLAALVAETARRQTALEARFSEAFESVDAAVEKRQSTRKMNGKRLQRIMNRRTFLRRTTVAVDFGENRIIDAQFRATNQPGFRLSSPLCLKHDAG
ncbi:MAG: hypothetical protein H8E66_10065 [Planctomycetes bacterium]|nr:hypothetical protein [Planctomycetota bacterium]MBL7038940.1 hypothetical protein [Pirellulaceae bacterium]